MPAAEGPSARRAVESVSQTPSPPGRGLGGGAADRLAGAAGGGARRPPPDPLSTGEGVPRSPWRRPPSSHMPRMIPFSVLDLSPVAEGSDAAQALRNTLDLARHAERWGYHRYWLAEHHNMPGIASAATSVSIC